MKFSKIFVENFKGIRNEVEVEIKPLTIFLGPNSSGKSSCIHALACLSQSLRLSANKKPIILDDENALVHLGRFIEVVHSKKYKDKIVLGFRLDDLEVDVYTADKKLEATKVQVVAKYWFGSTMRTQDVYLEKAEISIGELKYRIVKESKGTFFWVNGVKMSTPVKFKQSFLVEEGYLFAGYPEKDGFRSLLPFMSYQTAILEYSKKIRYLGPFRQPPIRQYPTRGANPSDVGANGESAITLLANDFVRTSTKSHVKQVSSWINDVGLGKGVSLSRVGTSDMFDVSVELGDGKSFSLADLGYGVSQILPVLAQLSFAPKGSTLLFEQPEIHLHSIAVRKLAGVFASVAHEKKCSLILETHSPDLVGQFFKMIREEKLDINDIVVYRVTRKNGETCLDPLEIDPDGDVFEDWEKGISIEYDV